MGKNKKTAGRAVGKHRPKNSSRDKRVNSAEKQVSLKNIVLVLLAIVVLSLIIYAPSLNYGFLGFDDPAYVSENVEVSRGLTWHGFLWAFNIGYSANWHPLTWLSHMLDVQLFGMVAGCHHLINLLLHIANALLLFWLLYRTTRGWGRSAVVALLFAVHPLHVESVVWIAERKDVLSTLLWMLTFHAYVSYVRRPLLRRLLVVIVVFSLGLMAKSMLVTLPFALILFDIWPLGRLSLNPGRRRVLLQLFVEKIPFIALSAISSVLTIMAQARSGAVQNLEMLTFSQRAANAVVSYFMYIAQMIWPGNLIAYYAYETPSALMVVAGVLILASVSALTIRFAKRHPYLLVGWLWYLFTLVPVIGLVQVGAQSRADRYTYIPIIGLFIAMAWGIPKLVEGRRRQNIGMGVAAALLICALTVLARNQVGYWENDATLWEHVVRSRPRSSFARTNLGSALAAAGDLDGAVDQYTEALRINPNFAETHNALGMVLTKKGLWREAAKHYAEALRLKPGIDAHTNLGMVLGKLGEFEEAISEFQTALKIDPNSAETHNELGVVLARKGLWSEAEQHYAEALRLEPDFAYAHANRGTLLAKMGRIEEAISEFRTALKIDPQKAAIYYNLGFALAGQGKMDEAISQYRKAIEIQPLFAEAHTNLGFALMNQNQYTEAIQHFKEALRINPNSVQAKRSLEIALSRQ